MTIIRFQPNPLRALQVSLTNVNVVEVGEVSAVMSAVDSSGFEYFFEVDNPLLHEDVVAAAKRAWLEEQEYRHAMRVRSELDGGVV